jgi:hypothetical protein
MPKPKRNHTATIAETTQRNHETIPLWGRRKWFRYSGGRVLAAGGGGAGGRRGPQYRTRHRLRCAPLEAALRYGGPLGKCTCRTKPSVRSLRRLRLS